ncbi:hypothetical protein RSAG8_07751, partial [Rhizoctonia solani AG-8 WAC10335]
MHDCRLFPTPARRQPPKPAFLIPLGKELRSKPSISDLSDLDRYYGTMPENHKPHMHQLASTYSLDPDPAHWGMKGMHEQEPDDDLHNPEAQWDDKHDRGVSMRGVLNVGCLAVLITSVLVLFAGYPLIDYFTNPQASTLGAYNLGGINASGQVPELPSHRGLVDADTPKSAYTRKSTNNLEWYDPAQVTTTGGSLRIELSAKHEHGLNYTGGMLSSWNKFCFTGGYIEANVSLPGSSKTYGLWPAVWTMGNLGRAGYGASLEGTWPYTYDSCDVGTLANQTDPATNGPAAAHTGGVSSSNSQTGGCFSTYGFEYKPGNDGYIQWANDGKMVWEVKAAGMGADSKTMIGQRPVSQEPMYILANLGMSYNFGPIDFGHLVFPAYMLVDYIRVYQPANQRNIGCDPPDYPTAEYINTYIEAYTNPNLTTWVGDYKQRMPKNRLIDSC